jgi:hypothetical protein
VRVRWLAADLKWLVDNARQQGAPDTVPTREAFASFLADFGKRTAYDYFDRRDLGPAMVALGSDVARLARSVRERLT